jgi:hypothetical protein
MISKTTVGLRKFQLLGSLRGNDEGFTCEIRSGIAMVHVAFNKKKTLFNSKLGRTVGRNEQNATFGPYLHMSLKL